MTDPRLLDLLDAVLDAVGEAPDSSVYFDHARDLIAALRADAAPVADTKPPVADTVADTVAAPPPDDLPSMWLTLTSVERRRSRGASYAYPRADHPSDVEYVPRARLDAALRERASFRSDLQKVAAIVGMQPPDGPELGAVHRWMEKLTRERDEAQKERDAARGEVAELLAHADADALMLTQVARERDAAIRERDEARARWDGYETARELECQGLRKERDEARAERDAAAVVCDRAAAAITGVIRGQITGAESTLIADLTHVARLHAARVVGITPPWHPEVARLQADLNEARAALDKAAAEEREACAEVAESVTTRIAPNRQEPITELDVICIANGRGETIAAAIRARGTR